jgi:hypothetical protein
MECIAAAIIVFVILVVPTVALLNWAWPSRGEEALKQVARRFSGAYFRGGWFRPPRVTMRYGAASAVLRLMKSGATSWAELAIYGVRPNMRLEIAPSNDGSLRMLEFDESLLPIGPVHLDPARPYMVYSPHKYDAERFLTDGVLVQLRMLQRWMSSAALVVTVEPGEIVVRKHWLLGYHQAAPLIEFVTLAMRLHDYILLGKEQGIEFIAPAQTPLEHLKCAICGEAMGIDYVACRTCSAPHHHDCWKYNGACGMFACKETRYEMVRSDAHKTPPRDLRWQ